MAVPQDVSSTSDEIAVTDRSAMSGALADESFKMGPYQVTDVSRKWTSSESSSFFGASSGATKDGYTFALKAADGAYKGSCASQLDEQTTGLLGGTFGTQNYTVLCQCNGPAQSKFTISAGTTSHYQGAVEARASKWAIEGVYTDDKGSSVSKPVGYKVRGDASVGAVEVTGKGRVWLAKGLDPGAKSDLACLFAGLLLYKEPQGKMDK